MGYLTWTKTWSANDNGIILTGAHLGTIQSDITAVLNGGISDANIATAAAILESKISFNTSTGHNHDGSNSRTIAASTFISQHDRKGCFVRRTGNDTLSVTAGSLNIGGTIYSKTSATTLTGSTAGDYITGSEPTSATIYVYGYNNSGTLGFKMHTAAPNLSDTSDNAAEEPWRYLKNGGVYYRCVGAIYNNASQNFVAGSEVNFDASSFASGYLLADGTDQTVVTLWTPDLIQMIVPAADPPAATAEVNEYLTHRRLLADFTLVSHSLNGGNVMSYETNTSFGGQAKTITAQAAGTPGSFTIQASTSGFDLYWSAWSKERG